MDVKWPPVSIEQNVLSQTAHEHMQRRCCAYELDREEFHPPVVRTTRQHRVPLNHDIYLDVILFYFIIRSPIYLLTISVRMGTNVSSGSKVSLRQKKCMNFVLELYSDKSFKSNINKKYYKKRS